MQPLRAKYVESTRQALLDTGRRMFAERDYADIAAEEIVRSAGLTRGALYHHFDGKPGLFEAIFEEFESDAAERIKAAVQSATDPLECARRGIDEFLDLCAEDTYRHIVLLQGPIALGWTRWRELDQRYLAGIVIDVLQALVGAELIKPYPVELLASAFYGALTELSWAIAEADDTRAARAESARLANDLLAGLAPRRHP